VEVLGRSLDIDLRHGWRLDQTFLDLLIDKDALLEIAKELDLSPGKAPTCAALRAMIHRKIQGEGCKAIEDWLPGYLEFPPRGYTERFNAQTVTAYARLAGALGLPTPIEPLVMPDTSAFKKADGETAHESEVAEAFDHAA
jgi:ParB family chromosome partitioning protein